ncbi:hypothetical protein EV356DRAFT_510341 [Viridothelium virens]|uniref:Uncharacterized protein n=1 Tax=Viridothelium virens TaxID=1048519 RepID=A0A6A6GVZ1_VIRVR|nr:hypothetical protein EV356DRAFT_510341 [Viridothelium virens]
MASYGSLKLLFPIIALGSNVQLTQSQPSDSDISSTLFNYVGSPKTNNGPAGPFPPNATGQFSQQGFSPPHGPSYLGETWTWTTAVYDLIDFLTHEDNEGKVYS